MKPTSTRSALRPSSESTAPNGDGERVLGGAPVDLEGGGVPVRDLPPPDQRVVGVVVGVGGIDEEAERAPASAAPKATRAQAAAGTARAAPRRHCPAAGG